MKDNYSRALARILVYEGGKVNDPRDPGGRTNKGVTQATYSAWLASNHLPPADVFNIPEAHVDAIYRGEYWDRIQGDVLPSGLDLAVFDAAVNSGCGQAAKWLQQALSVLYQGQIDGVIGSKVLAALQQEPDMLDVIQAFCARRLGTLQHLKTWPYFGKGWSARIANVQKTACSWADAAPEPGIPDLSGLKGSAKARITGQLQQPRVTQIAAHLATTAAGAATVASQSAQQIQGLADTFAWVKYIFAALTLGAVGAGVIAKISQTALSEAEAGSALATVDLEADANLPSITIISPTLGVVA